VNIRRFVACCSLSNDITTSVSAVGSPGRSEHLGHHIRQEEQDSRLLSFMAQDENLKN